MSLNLPTHQELIDSPIRHTVSSLAGDLYQGQTFDTAIPHEWRMAVQRRTGFDPYGEVVWLYPEDHLPGHPAPITVEGALGLARLAACLPS